MSGALGSTKCPEGLSGVWQTCIYKFDGQWYVCGRCGNRFHKVILPPGAKVTVKK